jgi:hypothetical protein
MGRKKQKIKTVVSDAVSEGSHGKLSKVTGNGRPWIHVFLKKAAMPRL